MRRHNDVRKVPEGRFHCTRFLFKNVQSCTTETVLLESINQGILVDDVTPSDVDEDCFGFHYTQFFRSDQLTRFVGKGAGNDQIVGFLDVKDVLGASDSDDRDVTASDFAREIPVVPETARVDVLLAEFQAEECQMAAVIDEWGNLEGIATVEDVVEAVVGDLRDVFDTADREPTQLGAREIPDGIGETSGTVGPKERELGRTVG